MFKLRGLLMALGTVAMSATAITLAIAPAQAASFNHWNIWNSSHCMDNATENNAVVQMWSCKGVPEQNWSLTGIGHTGFNAFMFTNQNTGWCLAAPAFGLGNAFMAPCNQFDESQQWRIAFLDSPSQGTYYLWENVSSGYCVSTNSVGNGTVLNMNNCDPSDLYDRWHQE